MEIKKIVSKEQIFGIISEQTGKGLSEINLTSKIVVDLGVDSLDLVELIMVLEEEIGQEISDKDAEKLLTVGDVLNYLQSKNLLIGG